MRRLSVKFRVVLGLVGLTVCIAMLAFYAGFIPDETAIVRENRKALAETIAVHSTAMVLTSEFQRLAADFKLLAARNGDLISLGLRRADGRSLIASAGHDRLWQSMEGEYSKNTQVRVPIWAGDAKWGQLELRFQALREGGFGFIFAHPVVRLTLFLGGLCFLAFYFYIGKVLRHLDPSKAIPGRVRSALDTLAGGLLVLDQKEQIVLANKSFASLLGKSPEDLLGYRAGDLPWVAPDGGHVDKADRPWNQALAAGQVQAARILRLEMAGHERHTFSINASPVLGAQGKYAGVLVSFDDVTVLEKKEIELRRSKEEAESANQAKSAFLANMSHEIRTPMTAILGFTEILKRGYDRNRRDSLRYLDTIHSSGHSLLELINDILDLSKVESGRLEIEKAWSEPHRIISDVLQVLNIKAREKGLALNFEARDDLPQRITTDPARFRQIVLNLVGNAIKFTDQGEIRVVCGFDASGGDARLVIDIVDAGVGIPADKQESIFDPFTQADASVTRHFGGTGLGLAISRRFAQALGGDITVESRPGEGSTFRITLSTGDIDGVPLLAAHEVAAATATVEAAEPPRWQFPAARILVVDDGAENRELLRLFFEEAGARVEEAANGQQGVESALAADFDVILMDVNMPVMDGFSATRELRRKGVSTPIIALTANAMKGFDRQCLEAGFSGYFSKPIDIDRLMQQMADLLGGQPLEAHTRTARTGAIADEDVAVTPAKDRTPIVSKLPVDNARFRDLVVRFIARLDTQLDAARQSHREGRMDELAAFAHWLKGAGGSVGFDILTAPAGKLEALAKSGGPDEEIAQTLEMLQDVAARLAAPGTASPEASCAVADAAARIAAPNASPKAVLADHIPPVISRLGGNPRLQKVIRKFITKLDSELKSAQSALDRGDLAQLAMIAHWLKGAGGTVGFDEFTAPAAELEQLAKADRAADAGRILEQLESLANAIVPPAAPQGRTTVEGGVGIAQGAGGS
ncbi:MAG: ATP-binding protein [Desulfobacterales bacterium]|nr:ATP-binding protein [Desulfobacterales bacterium]